MKLIEKLDKKPYKLSLRGGRRPTWQSPRQWEIASVAEERSLAMTCRIVRSLNTLSINKLYSEKNKKFSHKNKKLPGEAVFCFCD